jgi:YtkA-like
MAAGTGPTPRRFRRGSRLVVLGVMALVGIVVGGLYLALQLVPAAPPRTQEIGSVQVTFTTDPRVPWAGPAEARIWVVDAAGVPVTDAEVTLHYDMGRDSMGRPMSGMGDPGRSQARMNSPGRYTAPVNFMMAGQWTVRVAITRGGRDEGQGTFLITVR